MSEKNIFFINLNPVEKEYAIKYICKQYIRSACKEISDGIIGVDDFIFTDSKITLLFFCIYNNEDIVPLMEMGADPRIKITYKEYENITIMEYCRQKNLSMYLDIFERYNLYIKEPSS